MKLFLPIALGVVCIVLAVTLVKTKKDDTARHDTDAATITEYSNQLNSAVSTINLRNGTILTLSNSLQSCQSASLALSNDLTEARSAVQTQSGQITNLNQQLAGVTAEKQALDQQRTVLAGQMAALTNKLSQTEATLAQANKDYELLENRFRVDVGERLVIQRKFYNPDALQAQMEKLKSYQGSLDVTADQIYAGLDVEVKSNSFHVISPN